jgi:hypothetical protein
MISVRCPACEKAVGFDEADGGARVACPFCGESLFIPSVVVPVVAAPAPAATPPPPLPDDLRLVDDPKPEHLDELLPVEQEAPPPVPEPEAAPQPDPIPLLELAPVRPIPEPPEMIGTPAPVQPTDVAPSLAAAAALSEALPCGETKPEPRADRLEEVIGERQDEDRFGYEEEEEPRPRRRPRKKGTKRRPPPADDSPWPEGLTRTRVLGAVGVTAGGTILLGTLLHHLTASAWPFAACCGDLFGLALCGTGLYFLIRG